MESLKQALYWWNDWIVGAAVFAIGIVLWVRTQRPSALLVAIGTTLLFVHTIIEAVLKPTPSDSMSYFYGGASAAVGLLGVLFLAVGGIWYLAKDRHRVQSNNAHNTDARPTPPRAG
jgi:hypothetical protein